jgi:hypothetical protein
MKIKGNVTSSWAVHVVLAIMFGIFSVCHAADEEPLEETVKYKAATMEQTVGFIGELTNDHFTFDQEQCVATTSWVKNQTTFKYIANMKDIDPSDVGVRLKCITLNVDRHDRKIKRVDSSGNVQLKSKMDVCTTDRESAERLRRAMRYLLRLCGRTDCYDCPPLPWE